MTEKIIPHRCIECDKILKIVKTKKTYIFHKGDYYCIECFKRR